jgi:hypothetical protein
LDAFDDAPAPAEPVEEEEEVAGAMGGTTPCIPESALGGALDDRPPVWPVARPLECVEGADMDGTACGLLEAPGEARCLPWGASGGSW